MSKEMTTGEQTLLKLLELLSVRDWEDKTIVKAIFATKLWNKLIQDLEMNPNMTEEYFLELMEDM